MKRSRYGRRSSPAAAAPSSVKRMTSSGPKLAGARLRDSRNAPASCGSRALTCPNPSRTPRAYKIRFAATRSATTGAAVTSGGRDRPLFGAPARAYPFDALGAQRRVVDGREKPLVRLDRAPRAFLRTRRDRVDQLRVRHEVLLSVRGAAAIGDREPRPRFVRVEQRDVQVREDAI